MDEIQKLLAEYIFSKLFWCHNTVKYAYVPGTVRTWLGNLLTDWFWFAVADSIWSQWDWLRLPHARSMWDHILRPHPNTASVLGSKKKWKSQQGQIFSVDSHYQSHCILKPSIPSFTINKASALVRKILALLLLLVGCLVSWLVGRLIAHWLGGRLAG